MNININGKEYPIFFGMMAIELVSKVANGGDIVGTAQIVEMVYAGMQNAAFRNREEVGVKFSDVYDAVEDMTTKADGKEWIADLGKAYNESAYVKKVSENAKESVKKKTQTGKKLNPSQ